MSNVNSTDGEEVMPHLPPKGRIEWNLNTIVTIGGILVLFVGNAFAMGVIYNTMQNNDSTNAASVSSAVTTFSASIEEIQKAVDGERLARKERGLLTDAKFKAIEDKVPEITRLDDKITRLTELIASVSRANEEVNKRIDRFVESQNTKLDTIISRQSDQSADIKVIQSQLSENQRTQRTGMPTFHR